jgi:hypothetical protein
MEVIIFFFTESEVLDLWAAISGIQARKIRILAPNLAETKPGDSWRSYCYLFFISNAAFPNSINLRFICIYRIPPPTKQGLEKKCSGSLYSYKGFGGT